MKREINMTLATATQFMSISLLVHPTESQNTRPLFLRKNFQNNKTFSNVKKLVRLNSYRLWLTLNGEKLAEKGTTGSVCVGDLRN